MIKFENTDVNKWECAIREMRNCMGSKGESDSYTSDFTNDGKNGFVIGKNDFNFIQELKERETNYKDYLRTITVQVDITAPLYWWFEFDIDKVGTVVDSYSLMDKVQAERFTLNDFSIEHLEDMDFYVEDSKVVHAFKYGFSFILDKLNTARELYVYFKERPMRDESARKRLLKRTWWQIIQLLPSSYNQKRTVILNFKTLSDIYNSKENYRLDEWKNGFISWIENLPYAKELITGKE